MRALAVAVVALTTAAVLPGSPAQAADPDVMRVTGKGGGILGSEFGEYAGDPVSFELDASAANPLEPTGTFHVVHRKPDGGLRAEFSGRATSVAAVDEVGIVTGVIEQAAHPGLPVEFVGKQVSFTVYDGGPQHGKSGKSGGAGRTGKSGKARQDRLGWVWGFFGAPVSRLQGTAPHFPLSWGDLTVQGSAGPEAAETAQQQVAIKSGSTGTSVLALLGGKSDSPAFKDDPLRFSVAARIAPGDNALQVRGRFHVTHLKPDGQVVADFTGKITCLAVGGPVGVATGVVTSSVAPELVGKPVSFSFKDGRVDRIGWIWGFADEPINDCQATVPFFAPDWGKVIVGAK
ncbi:hypothetical protein FB561_1240 [Kribbella amoyensis]|uniref:Uncharacterized protein n=1 Tax=Kribbella amoyensis TaxID=996641 RepID=A0A561BMV4_9ACTN|nr:hypothetical protein [Kribbella amoyensis]TWD80167.1 hypothetical protein FB561_1240 [Kribbella amoyensis]